MPVAAGRATLHPGGVVVLEGEPMINGQVVLVDEGRHDLGRRSQTATHVGLQTTKALGGQHALSIRRIVRFPLLCR